MEILECMRLSIHSSTGNIGHIRSLTSKLSQSYSSGMAVALYETHGEVATLVKRFTLNADGRNPDGPLYDNASLKAGTYRLAFDVAGYFRARGVQLPEPPFLNEVHLDFGIAHGGQHYHVPLLVSPWSYSTYRGS